MSMTLSFLDDSERLRRIGEPTPEELQRHHRVQELTQGLGADSGAPIAALMNQGAQMGAGLVSMLQQGAGNSAVAGMLAGSSAPGVRSAEQKRAVRGGGQTERTAAQTPAPAQAPAPAAQQASNQMPIQPTGGNSGEGEDKKKKRSGGLFGGLNKAFQKGADAIRRGLGEPIRRGGDAANQTLRNGMQRAQEPVDRMAQRSGGLGSRLRSWGDRQNATLQGHAGRANAHFAAPTQRMTGFAARLRSFGNRQNHRMNRAAMRANRQLARPTNRFERFGRGLRAWGNRQNAGVRRASQRANRALQRPAQRARSGAQALRRLGDRANAKAKDVGDGLVRWKYDEDLEPRFWKGQRRRQLGNRLNKALFGDGFNTDGMRQLPDRLDGRKWDGVPSQLTDLVSQSQRNLPPQVVAHIEGFLAKVTPEMEAQMSQGERERLERLRELVRQNQERAEQDAAADRDTTPDVDAPDPADTAPQAESTMPGAQPTAEERQQAPTPEAQQVQTQQPAVTQTVADQQPGVVQDAQPETSVDQETTPVEGEQVTEADAPESADQPTTEPREPTAAEVDIPEGPLVDLEETGQDEGPATEPQQEEVQQPQPQQPTVDEATRQQQQTSINEAQARANAATPPPAQANADRGGTQLTPGEVQADPHVQDARNQAPTGGEVDPGTRPRSAAELGEAQRGRSPQPTTAPRTTTRRNGDGPAAIGGQAPSVREQPELPPIDERRGRSMQGVDMSPQPVDMPGNRGLDGPNNGEETSPDGQPQKTPAQVEAEAQQVGAEAQSQLDVEEQALQDQAQTEADTRTAAAEAERDQREETARADGDSRIAAEEQRGQQQRADAEAEGQRRRTEAEQQQQQRQTEAETEGQRRETEAATQRDQDRAAEERRQETEIAQAEAERDREETELRAQVEADEQAAQRESEDRQNQARTDGEAEQARLESEGEAEQARLRRDAQNEAQRVRNQGQRDAQRREQQGRDAQRREEQAGRRRQRRLEADARRQRESQSWLSRAASWVASQFNSLMNRARQAFNSAVRAGRRLLNQARQAAQGLLQRARQAASRVIAAADRACGGVISRVRNAVQRVTTRIRTAIEQASQWLRQRVQQLRQRLQQGIQRFMARCRRAIQQIRAAVQSAIAAVVDAFNAAVEAARTWVREQIAAARQWLQETWESISTWVEERYNAIRDAIATAVQTIVTTVTEAVSQAYNWCAERLSEIGTWLSEQWDKFCEWAQEAFVKFWTGPWRDILIGVAVAVLIAAVTVATGGAGLAVIVAVSAGATAALRAGGEIAARRAAVAIRNDPERAARFQAEMDAEGGEAQRWYNGVSADETWMTTLGHGAVEGARGAVEGAVSGLVGGAGGAIGTRVASGIARAGAREGARFMGRQGVQRAAEWGSRMAIDAGLSLGGDMVTGTVNAELDVAMGIRTRDEAYAHHVERHLNPGALGARVVGSGVTGGLRMGSHRGPDTSVQDRIVQRVMGDAGRTGTSTVRSQVTRQVVDMSISGTESGVQGGMMSMANGGSFADGFGQGFVGGVGGHAGRLAGERWGRNRYPAPEAQPRLESDTSTRREIETDPTRPTVDNESQTPNGHRSIDDATVEQRRPVQDGDTVPQQRPPVHDGDTVPQRRPVVADDDATVPQRRPVVQDDDATVPRRVGDEDATVETQRPVRDDDPTIEVTQRIPQDGDQTQRPVRDTDPTLETTVPPHLQRQVQADVDPQQQRMRPGDTQPIDAASMQRAHAQNVQGRIAGRFGVPGDIVVVPDGTTPKPRGAITVTQAERWMRTVRRMHETPTGRATLQHMQDAGIRVVLTDADAASFSPGSNVITLGLDRRGSHHRAGIMAHEGGHSMTRAEVPDQNVVDRDTYMRGMMVDEAKAQAQLLEHMREARVPASREFGYEQYNNAYNAEWQRLYAQNPDMPMSEMHRRARAAGESELATWWGANVAPNSQALKPDGTPASSYNDYYGSWYDHNQQRRQSVADTQPMQRVEPDPDPTSARRTVPEGEAESSTTARQDPPEVEGTTPRNRPAPPEPEQVRGLSPIEIPSDARARMQELDGYDQVKFTWRDDDGIKYEARWHTRTPGAPEGAPPTWVVSRTIPGTPDGQRKRSEFYSGTEWVRGSDWYGAIRARQDGTATPQQVRILDEGHHHTTDPRTNTPEPEVEAPAGRRTEQAEDTTVSDRRTELAEPGTTYSRRRQLLTDSDGDLATSDAYTVGQPSKAQLTDPQSWVPERRALHEQLLVRARQDAAEFARATADQPDTIYAMRGNTAAGKTRAIRGNIPELEGAVEATSQLPHRAINPDNFKHDLIQHEGDSGLRVNHSQVHSESSALARRLQADLLDGPGSLLVDKRLGDFEDVEGLMHQARQTGRSFNVYDVDAPLEASLVGVLLREPGGLDPIPPFAAVAEGGFVPARANRDRSMALFEGADGAATGKYELFGTDPSGGKRRIAEVVNGERIIHDAEAFRAMQQDPMIEVNRLRNEVIDDSVIARVVGPLPDDFGAVVRNALERHRGRTWEQALAVHERAVPTQTDAPGPAPRRVQPGRQTSETAEGQTQGMPMRAEPESSGPEQKPLPPLRNEPDPQTLHKDSDGNDKLHEPRYQRLGEDVFPTEPSMKDVQQGYIADCYLIAGMASIARMSPDTVRNMITDHGDGTVTVRLFTLRNGRLVRPGTEGATPTQVRISKDLPTVNGRTPTYAKGAQGALWPALIEKAYASHIGRAEYQSLNTGGNAGRAMEVMTGERASHFTTRSGTPDSVLARIQQALDEGNPIVAGSLSKQEAKGNQLATDRQVFPWHAYTVEEITPDGMIRLYNPWGSRHPKLLTPAEFTQLYNNVYVGQLPPRPGQDVTSPGPQQRVDTTEGATQGDAPTPATRQVHTSESAESEMVGMPMRVETEQPSSEQKPLPPVRNEPDPLTLHKDSSGNDKLHEPRYQRLGEDVFPTEPSMKDVQQGYIADCYLIAGMASIARMSPDTVRNMITDHGDGTVTVRLFTMRNGRLVRPGTEGATPTEVRISKDLPTVNGRTPTYAKGAQGALWPALIEKAYASHIGGAEYQSLNTGGNAGRAMEVMTGERATHFTTRSGTPESVLARIQQALDEGNPIVAGSLSKQEAKGNQLATDRQVFPWHAYTVEEITPDGMIRLYNPWGSRHPKLLTPAEFTQLYNNVYVGQLPPRPGQDAPAPRPEQRLDTTEGGTEGTTRQRSGTDAESVAADQQQTRPGATVEAEGSQVVQQLKETVAQRLQESTGLDQAEVNTWIKEHGLAEATHRVGRGLLEQSGMTVEQAMTRMQEDPVGFYQEHGAIMSGAVIRQAAIAQHGAEVVTQAGRRPNRAVIETADGQGFAMLQQFTPKDRAESIMGTGTLMPGRDSGGLVWVNRTTQTEAPNAAQRAVMADYRGQSTESIPFAIPKELLVPPSHAIETHNLPAFANDLAYRIKGHFQSTMGSAVGLPPFAVDGPIQLLPRSASLEAGEVRQLSDFIGGSMNTKGMQRNKIILLAGLYGGGAVAYVIRQEIRENEEEERARRRREMQRRLEEAERARTAEQIGDTGDTGN